MAQPQRVSQVTEGLTTAGYDVAVGGLEQLMTATMSSSGLLLSCKERWAERRHLGVLRGTRMTHEKETEEV